MIVLKKLWLLLFLLFIFSSSYSQNISWMLGKWKGTNYSKKSQSIRMLDITSVNASNFVGTRSIEVNGKFHMQIVTEISGHINKDTFFIKDGSIILKKEPPRTVWVSCSQCVPFNQVFIRNDSLLLTSTVSSCDPSCDGVISYYKMVPDFDTSAQRVVINMFGTPEQILAFNSKQNNTVVASSDPDTQRKEDSVRIAAEIAKRKQRFEDSLKIVAASNKKKEQQMLDSLKVMASIAKKRQQEVNDSLQYIARIKKQRQQQIDDSLQYIANIQKAKRQQEITDSLKNAAAIAKQKQQQYDDSIKIAKQRQQQIDDSLQAVANLEKQRRQQQIADSLKNAADIAEQKQQQYDDSVKLAKLQQQHIQDSLQNVALIARKRQQQIDDSLQNVAKLEKQKRQQEIADSLKNAADIAKQKQQQYDNSVKLAKLQQQHIQDSLQNAALIAKKRQQQIDDSLQAVANLEKQKRQQQVADSLKNAAIIAKQKQQQYDDSVKVAKLRQQHIQDSLQNAAIVAKKRQQQIADSLKIVANIAKQKKQQEIADSTRNAVVVAKQKQQRYDDSVKVAQQRQKRIDDSLQNIASLAKIRQQEIDDSIKIAAGKKQIIPDTAKTTTAKSQADKSKALMQRDNVLLQTYHIKNPDILIELFDNAEIDGDRVSVFHNNSLIVNNQTLLREPITFKVHADSLNRMHEFILVAENLGSIPPNTALMRITADNQQYKLSVKTDLKTNAKIVFYYDGN